MRQWFGKIPAERDVLNAAEAAESQPRTLYCLDGVTERGDYVDVVAGLRSKLQALQCDPSNLKSHSPERSLQQLLMVLVDCVCSDSDRLSVLEDLGRFRVDPDLSSDERKAEMLNLLQVPEGGVGHEGYEKQAQRLGEIWTPEPEELLDAVINHPSALGELLSKRLEPAEGASLLIVAHPFDRLDDGTFEALLASNTAAYEKDGTINVLGPLPGFLDSWDSDPLMGGSPEAFSLFETLLLHEFIEIILSETTQLEPLPCHIVASTFERCLRDRILSMAVEAFYLDWSSARSEARDREEAPEEGATSGVDGEEPQQDVTIEHGDVSAEAYVERTDNERERVLAEMFAEGESVESRGATENPGSAQPAAETPSPAPVAVPERKKSTLADLIDDEDDPAPEIEPQTPPAEPEEPELQQRIASTGKRTYKMDPVEEDGGPVILIVDDSSMSRQMVRSVVETLGFTPVEATDGIQAIAQARYHEPVLIVLDIIMPGKSGIETLQELRNEPKFAETPIIMLTSKSERESIQQALLAKANDYLVKPVNLRELEKRIKQFTKEQS